MTFEGVTEKKALQGQCTFCSVINLSETMVIPRKFVQDGDGHLTRYQGEIGSD